MGTTIPKERIPRMLRVRGASIVLGCVLVLVLVLVGVRPAAASHGDHVVIAEVQVGGANARDEFVELYNPTAAPATLEGWRLSKRTGTGAREENLVTVFPVLVIAPHASVLVAHSEGSFAASSDQKYTTQSSLANDNVVVLYGPAPAGGGERPVVDLVGFGTVTSKEGTAAPNPPASQSLERKPGGAEGNGQDTGDNATDFVIQATPTPQGVSAAARPAVVDEGLVDEVVGATPTINVAPSSSTPVPSSTTSTATTEAAPSPTASTTTSSSSTSPSSTTVALVEPSRPTTSLPSPTHVRINEFVPDPEEGDEWIELVNIGPVPINFADWTIEDGAETKTRLDGAIGIGPQRFLVVRKPKGALNNSGDRIALKNPSGNVVDAVTYGEWNDGRVSDNAPTASDPASVARLVDGVDTDDDRRDFVRTEVPTPAQPNVITGAPVPASDAVPKSASSGGGQASVPDRPIVILSELFPNPSGGDDAEFVELANVGGQPADIAGWRLRDELGSEYVIAPSDGPTAIAAGGTLALPRSRTAIALNNTGGETVKFFAPGHDRATATASFDGAAPEGLAWARGTDGRWSWTLTPTPGKPNDIAVPNRPPAVRVVWPERVAPGEVATFDASDTADLDRDVLSFLWDFGDPTTEADHATGAHARYVYGQPGTYTATLTVTDAQGATVTEQRRIVVRGEGKEKGQEEIQNSEVDAARSYGAGSKRKAQHDDNDDTDGEEGGAPSSKKSARRGSRSSATIAVESLAELRDLAVGSSAQVRGIVTAPLGVVGKQIFYVADESSGVQIFVGKRAIPSLAVGSVVEVRGELREVGGERRVGIARPEDVRVVGNASAPESLSFRAREASAELVGTLVAVEGEVIEVRGRTVVLDDGSDEIRVMLPTASATDTTAEIRSGGTVRVVGVLSRTQAGYRILARTITDVTVITQLATTTRDPATPLPIRNNVEVAAIGAGGSALAARTLWRRRRLLSLALAAVRKVLSFRRHIS